MLKQDIPFKYFLVLVVGAIVVGGGFALVTSLSRDPAKQNEQTVHYYFAEPHAGTDFSPQSRSRSTRSASSPHTAAPLPNSSNRTGELCAQVITRAVNPETQEVVDYSTPCDVPEGWERISN